MGSYLKDRVISRGSGRVGSGRVGSGSGQVNQGFSRIGSPLADRVASRGSGRDGSGQGNPIRPVRLENLLTRPVRFRSRPDPTGFDPRVFQSS